MLVLFGIEAIFFTVGNMGLCFAFVLKRVDNRDVLFITQQTRLFCLSPHPTNEQTGVHKEHLVGALIGQLTPTDPRHILDQMTSGTAYKTAEIRSKEGYSVMTSVFPSHHYGAQLPIPGNG